MAVFHAAAPFEAPLAVRSGSAFSAATADVAVTPERRIAAQRVVHLPAPSLPQPSALQSSLPVVARAGEPLRAWPDPTGPPPPFPLAERPAPRAPPLA